MSEKPTDKVTFVVLKSTRQIMAVATRQALPATAVPTGSEDEKQLAANAADELKVLVGDNLVVRDLFDPIGGSPLTDQLATIVLPASQLEVVTVDFKPTEFKIKDARGLVIGTEKKPKPVEGQDPQSITLNATATRVRVGLLDLPAQDTEVTVWVYPDDGSTPFPAAGVIKKPEEVFSPPRGASVDLPVFLKTGDYHFLALVQGYKPAVFHQDI
jgi:hypothetical protein